MGINTLLNSVSASLAQQTSTLPVRSSVVSTNAAQKQTAQSINTASVTGPSESVVQTAGLLSASSNFAQLGSLLEVAQTGTQQVNSILQQLVSLAQQVPQTNDLSGIDSEFSQLLAQLHQTATGATFGDSGLLDGTYNASLGEDTEASQFSLPDLTPAGLFGSGVPSLSTQANGQNALTLLSAAQATTDAAATGITGLLSQLNFAAASVSSALANNDAASSTLTDSDMEGGLASDGFASLLGSPAAAAQVQTGNLSASLLGLLQE